MKPVCKYRGHTYDSPTGACTVCGEVQVSKNDPFVKEGLKYVSTPSKGQPSVDDLLTEELRKQYQAGLDRKVTPDLHYDAVLARINSQLLAHALSCKPSREEIRKIWRPLYDMTDKDKKQWTGQGMAYLISQCVDETQDLMERSLREGYK